MAGWDISPVGVETVVSHVGEVMSVLNDIVQAYAGDVQGAAASAGTLAPGGASGANKGQTGLVAAALAEFIEGTASELQFIGSRVGASVYGAQVATLAYQDGNVEMAAEVQRQAAGLIEPDMPDGWKSAPMGVGP